jgi:hypothetical protein
LNISSKYYPIECYDCLLRVLGLGATIVFDSSGLVGQLGRKLAKMFYLSYSTAHHRYRFSSLMPSQSAVGKVC